MKYDLYAALAELEVDHPGWIGHFVTSDAPGAMKRGTRIHKVRGEPGDSHPLGATGTVLGSVYDPPSGTGYFVEWDTRKYFAVLVISWKIERMQ